MGSGESTVNSQQAPGTSNQAPGTSYKDSVPRTQDSGLGGGQSGGGESGDLVRLQAALRAADARVENLEQQLARCLGERSRDLEQERLRIAREIHDGVAQNLALLLVKMEILSRLMDRDPAQVKSELARATSVLEATVRQLRASLSSLRPSDRAPESGS